MNFLEKIISIIYFIKELSMKKEVIVLFDLDGTLLNTNNLIIKSFKHTFKEVLSIEVSSEELMQYFGETLETTLERFDKQKIKEMVKTYREFNFHNHDNLVEPFPMVKETLMILKEKGCKIGVVTSKSKKMCVKGLKLYDLFNFFDVVVSKEDTSQHKPSPAPIIKALNDLQANPEAEVYYIGDSPFDIISAREAGVIPVGVKWSVRLNDLKELNPLIVSSLIEVNDLIFDHKSKTAK
ncbi:pyrophosphatase PpaX [Proteinivorax tanatarense]|uniref:Pyrophosphatase PpaX n=1 Tax=Proteinivorax tanatarense TaxID=1260629 RepID=A0AAU7VIR0_9FIRM